jgi:hypothetical protein
VYRLAASALKFLLCGAADRCWRTHCKARVAGTRFWRYTLAQRVYDAPFWLRPTAALGFTTVNPVGYPPRTRPITSL